MKYLVEVSIIVKRKQSHEIEGMRQFQFYSDTQVHSCDLLKIATIEAKKRWSTARVTNVWEV